MKVLVIGLGVIGYNTAKYIQGCGPIVDGFDLNEIAAERAVSDGVIRQVANTFDDYDHYIIAISTHNPRDQSLPFTEGILGLAHRLSEEGRSGAHVGIESTVSRGLCDRVETIVGHRLHVSHVPHRYFGAEPTNHGINQTRVLGGCNPCCVEISKKFYGEVLGIPLRVVKSIEVAELSKIVENSYRFLEISFAEELKMFCDESGLNFEELRDAINSKWNVNILEAKDGIGGHCLPKDSQMYLNAKRGTSLLQTAKVIDQEYRLHPAQKDRKRISLVNQVTTR